MKREREFAKNTVILSIGSFLPKIATFITLPILTAYLTKSEYGTYDLIITLVSLMLPAVTLQIQSAAFRFLIDCRKDEKKVEEIVSTILFFTLGVSIVALIILYFALYKLSPFTRILISVYFFADIILLAVQQVARGLGRNVWYSIATTINSFLSMVLIVIVVKQLTLGINGILLAHAAGIIVSIIFLAFKLKLHTYFKIKMFSKPLLVEMLKYSWPMVPNNLSRWVLNLSDRLVVTAVLGISTNAVYAVANKIPNLLNTFQSAFIFAWQENASIALKDKDSSEYYTKMFDRIFCILSGVTALLIASTPIVFKILIHGDYDEAYDQMPFLYLGVLFSAVSAFSGGIYVAYKKTKNVGLTTIAAAGANLLINISLIHFIGLYAASISTMLSYFILMIYRMVNSLKFQKMSYNIKKIVVLIVLISIMGVLSVQRNWIIDIINLVLGCGIMYFFNADMVNAMFKKAIMKIKRH